MGEWIKTSDRLPPREKMVLCWGKPDVEFYCKKYSGEKRENLESMEGVWMGKIVRSKKLLSWDKEPVKPLEWTIYNTIYNRFVITHWMPLPWKPVE